MYHIFKFTASGRLPSASENRSLVGTYECGLAARRALVRMALEGGSGEATFTLFLYGQALASGRLKRGVELLDHEAFQRLLVIGEAVKRGSKWYALVPGGNVREIGAQPLSAYA